MAMKPLRVIQVSDIHLFTDPEKDLLGVKTKESFQAVFDLVRQHKDSTDLVILSGDMSQDGSRESYENVAAAFNQLNIPIYFVPGNHDNPKMYPEVYPLGMVSDNKHLVFKHWQLILLDSQIPGSVEGRLASSQLRFLQTCLNMHPEHHAAVIFHHQPVPVGCQWLDNLGLQNADELFEVMSHYPLARTIVFGHVHQEYDGEHHGIRCFSAPSTCIQFKTKSAGFALEKLPPGFRKITFQDNGDIDTQVIRCAEYVGHFDVEAKGY